MASTIFPLPGADRLRCWVNEKARTHLEAEVFGKRILAANRDEWSTEDIVLAYHGQHHVEAVFRQCKDDEHLAVRPQHHWTGHKIRVHTFMCLLALLLARVVEREARKLQRTDGLSGILDLLGTVRLAMVLTPSGEKGDGRERRGSLRPETGMPRISFTRSCPTDPRLCIRTLPPERPYPWSVQADRV